MEFILLKKHLKSVFSFTGLLIKQNFWSFVLLLFFSSIYLCVDIYFGPELMGAIVQYLQEAHVIVKSELLRFALLYAGYIIFLSICFMITQVIKAFLLPNVEKKSRIFLFKYFQDFSFAFYRKHSAGFLENTIDSLAESIREIMQHLFDTILPTIAMAIMFTIQCFFVSKKLGYITIIWSILHGLFYFFINYLPIRASIERTNLAHERTSIMMDCINNNYLSRMFRLKTLDNEKVSKIHEEETNAYKKFELLSGVIGLLGGVICATLQVGVFMMVALYAYKTDNMEISSLIKILISNIYFVINMFKMTDQLAKISESIGQCRSCLEVATRDNPEVYEGQMKLNYIKGAIDIRNLSYYYGNRCIFDKFSMSIPAGAKVAIIGPSGSGKTTLLNIISRITQIPRGIITIDKIDICDLNVNFLRSHIAYMSQDNYMYNGTIYENIAIGRLDASENDFIVAAEKAGIHETIMSLPDSYDSPVSSLSYTVFSGGERRRICLARAFLAQKSHGIFFADEPTTGLDPILSDQIIKNILDSTQNQTLLFATHDLSILNRVDYIILVMDGNAVFGTHADLLKKEPYYKTFISPFMKNKLSF